METPILALCLVFMAFASPAHAREPLRISSPDFGHGQFIPPDFTCQGHGKSPTLDVTGVPEGTESLVLIVDDPDAPVKTWDHWIVFDIEPGESGILHFPSGAKPGIQAMNSFRRQDWGGPCPPSGTHRYFFKVFALDKKLGLSAGVERMDVEEAMKGHVLAEAELMGQYKKF